MTIFDLDILFQNLLEFQKFASHDSSQNGIQVAGNLHTPIHRVHFAVDACRETFLRSQNADLLVVHHGLYWSKNELPRAFHYERLKLLMDKNIALYAIHLPLDAHFPLGNNFGIAQFLQLQNILPFGYYKNQSIGASGSLPSPKNLFEIQEMLAGQETLATLPFGKKQISTIAIVSGSGSFAIHEAIEKNIDLFITGDADHTIYHTCLEASINVIFAGHYFTETWGLRSLMKHFQEGYGDQHSISVEFIDNPTGL